MITLAGFLIALIIGLTGIGGGVLTAPVLLLLLGLPAPQAVGTALVYVTVVKLFAAPLFAARKQVNYRTLLFMLAGGLPGAVLGSLALASLDAKGAKGPMLLLLGIIVVSSATVNLFRKRPTAVGADKTQRLPWVCLPIGMEVGFSSAGAGALGSLALMHWSSLTAAQIVGTDLMFGLGLSAAAGGLHLSHGYVDFAVLKPLLIGGIPGSLLGAFMATRVPSMTLRKVLSVWLIGLGAHLSFQGWQALAR